MRWIHACAGRALDNHSPLFMNRFFLPPEVIQAGEVIFPGEFSHQIARVLRLKPGEMVIVLDNLGSEYCVELVSVAAKDVRGIIRESRTAEGEPPVRLSLYLCLTQREKLEWILQKCTETGVAEFVPVISSRSLVRDQAGLEKKMERWRRIVREAAEQSGRGRVPGIMPVMTLEQALKHGIAGHQACFQAWENENKRGLTTALLDCMGMERIALLIGPEGGLSTDEVQTAETLGWLTFSLGKRTLRMETAAVVAVARILAAFEDRLN